MIKLAVVALVLITTFVGCTDQQLEYKTTTVTFDSTPTQLTVRIADTPKKQEVGLGETESLGENEGMVFPFAMAEARSFWMKGMTFPIDIIWIENGLVVGVSANAQPESANTPESDYRIYSSNAPVTMVIETPAGWAARNGVKLGTTLEIDL